MPDQLLNKEQRHAHEEVQLQQAEAAFAAQQAPEATQQPQQVPPAAAAVTPEQAQVDWEKRYKDLQSHSDKERARLAKQLEEAGLKPNGEDEAEDLRKTIAELQQFQKETQVRESVQKAQQAVAQAHPDFEEVISDPIFEEWIKQQPTVFQNAIYDEVPDAVMASKALTLFKSETGLMGSSMAQADTRKQEQAEAAQAVGGNHREAPVTQDKKIWSMKEIQSMSASQYDKFEKEIDLAYAEGRIR